MDNHKDGPDGDHKDHPYRMSFYRMYVHRFFIAWYNLETKEDLNTQDSKYKSRRRFCGKCGGENPYDARFCRQCGFFMGEEVEEVSKKSEKPLDLTPPKQTEIIDETKKKSIASRCPRCGQDVEGLELCPVCGLIAPLGDETPDDFIGDFMVGVPVMLSKPEKFAEILPYHRGLRSLIQPVLWTTLFFIIFYNLSFLSRLHTNWLQYLVGDTDAPFLWIKTILMVFIMPWVIVIYIILLQGTSLLVGGRGIIERTARILCFVLSSALLYSVTLLAFYYITEKQLKKHELYISSSPWHDQFLIIPFVLKVLIFAGLFYLFAVQIRILARVHYIEPWRSVAAHIIAAAPFVVLFILNTYGYI